MSKFCFRESFSFLKGLLDYVVYSTYMFINPQWDCPGINDCLQLKKIPTKQERTDKIKKKKEEGDFS